MTQQLNKPLSEVWNLERAFPGGSESPALQQHLEQAAADVERFVAQLPGLPVAEASADVKRWVEALEALQQLLMDLGEAGAFASCSVAQDVNDEQARIAFGRVRQLNATLDAALTTLDEKILATPEDAWQTLLAHERVAPIAFALEERRTRAQDRLAPDKEALAVELGVNGYHGWGQMYTMISNRIRIPFEQDGETQMLSVGQAANRMSDPDRETRARLFAAYEEGWAEQADLLASTLNNLAGYRLTLYRYRGWDSVLKEPLDYNRMTEDTLNAMWDAVNAGKPKLVEYLNAKAGLLGLDKLNWFDLMAPVGGTGGKISYDEAARFIVDQFGEFSPGLAAMATTAFNDGWIEAEDRPGKGAGGFCASLPITGESRIFLTYGGRPESVDTLAHELGHAYHFNVMKDMPPMARRYPMNLAETASTLGEMIVADGSLRAATDPMERLALLDNRLSRAVAFFMDIHARFLFETGFYAARHRGPLTVGELNDRMEAAQREAFADALAGYHPLFWASKLHFHITYMPFYNFPYTFGYLFSAGIYARREQLGDAFPTTVDNLLRDTGRMGAEQLARKHLNVDLQSQAFWDEAVTQVLADVDAFVALAAETNR